MKARRGKRPLLIVGCLVVSTVAAVAMWLFQEVEYLRFDSPDGRHTAIVTYRRYKSYLPTSPGQSGDKAGTIRIEDMNGINYGRVAIPMVWMSRDLEWTNAGARLALVADWDFEKAEYRYWNDAQTEEIVKHAK